jgi:hypothetical protein
VHVCQRWRRIIFSSQRRLDLYLGCSESYGTRVRRNLAYWPATLPLRVTINYPSFRRHTPEDDDGLRVLAALQHPGRVHHIDIRATGPLLKKFAKVMGKPFPALSHLEITWNLDGKQDPTLGSIPVIPRRFLGRSASQLRHLSLTSVSFPQLPALLLSARNLVTLELENIFQDGYAYISPEALAKGLILLLSLTTLSLVFHDETSPTDQSSNPQDPPIRTILPSLTEFYYDGYSEYLEDFLAQIDTPLVDHVKIEYYAHNHQASQLSRFINRTENLKFNQFRHARVDFSSEEFSMELDRPQGGYRQAQLSLTMHQCWTDMPVPYSAHIFGQLAATFSNVDHLSVEGDQMELDVMESSKWLPFLRQFPAVEALHLSGGVAAYITSALEHTADSVSDLLPALHVVWIDDEENDDDVPVGSIESFLSLRQLSGRPVTIVDTHDEYVEADRNPL